MKRAHLLLKQSSKPKYVYEPLPAFEDIPTEEFEDLPSTVKDSEYALHFRKRENITL